MTNKKREKKGKKKQRKYWEPDEETILERAAQIRATWSEDKLLSRRMIPVKVSVQVVKFVKPERGLPE